MSITARVLDKDDPSNTTGDTQVVVVEHLMEDIWQRWQDEGKVIGHPGAKADFLAYAPKFAFFDGRLVEKQTGVSLEVWSDTKQA